MIKLRLFNLLANMILENMDDTFDPCENFYQFTCGSFDKNKRMEDDQAKITEFSILRDKVAIQVAGIVYFLNNFIFII